MTRTVFRTLIGVCALGLATIGCGPDRPPNILLISLDTLRADSLSSYGYERATSPFLDELAAKGVRFDNAFVNTLATTPSHVSILSSQYQESHGVLYYSLKEEGLEAASIPQTVPLLPEIFSAAGYTTLGVTGAGNFATRQGFDRGFDEFDGSKSKGVQQGVRRLLAMLDRHASTAPLFVLFHTYEIHAPYRPPAPFDTAFGETPESDFVPSSARLTKVIDSATEDLSEKDLEKIRRLYDGGILFTDEAMSGLFTGLANRGFFEDDYLVVVTSDHGEEFGERGGVLHRGLLYDEFLRVPLILEGSRLPSGKVRSDLVSSIDIAPTILGYAGLEAPESMQGVDLLRVRPQPAERQAVIAQYRRKRYAVRTPRWKYISARRPELYDLSQDPGETTNLAAQHPDQVSEFQTILDSWQVNQEGRRPAAEEAGELTPEQLEEMKALGYVN